MKTKYGFINVKIKIWFPWQRLRKRRRTIETVDCRHWELLQWFHCCVLFPKKTFLTWKSNRTYFLCDVSGAANQTPLTLAVADGNKNLFKTLTSVVGVDINANGISPCIQIFNWLISHRTFFESLAYMINRNIKVK